MSELQEIKVCLGRFQPFTLGHLKMATYKDLKGPDKDQQDKLREQPNLEEISKQKTIILAVSTPNDKVDTRHPFNDDLMKKEFELVKKNYKNDIEDVLYVSSADICAWGELIKKSGYKASVWLTGSDEFNMYKSMAIKVPEYEEHNRNNKDCKDAYTKSFYVEEIERTEDKDFVSSISGTKVRQSLLDGDKELFGKMMPKGMEQYFDEFKEKVENAPESKKKPSKKNVKEGMISLKDYILENMSSKGPKYKEPIKEKGLHKISVPNYLDGGYGNYEVNVIYAVNDENQLRNDESVIVINDPKNKHKYQDYYLSSEGWMMLTVYDNEEDPKETWKDYNINLKCPDWFNKEKLMNNDELEKALKKIK